MDPHPDGVPIVLLLEAVDEDVVTVGVVDFDAIDLDVGDAGDGHGGLELELSDVTVEAPVGIGPLDLQVADLEPRAAADLDLVATRFTSRGREDAGTVAVDQQVMAVVEPDRALDAVVAVACQADDAAVGRAVEERLELGGHVGGAGGVDRADVLGGCWRRGASPGNGRPSDRHHHPAGRYEPSQAGHAGRIVPAAGAGVRPTATGGGVQRVAI
jgi:hypothetical protein